MTARFVPRPEWAPAALPKTKPQPRCCAKCRRGVPGYGELPCGYNLACPNDCHKTKESAR